MQQFLTACDDEPNVIADTDDPLPESMRERAVVDIGTSTTPTTKAKAPIKTALHPPDLSAANEITVTKTTGMTILQVDEIPGSTIRPACTSAQSKCPDQSEG